VTRNIELCPQVFLPTADNQTVALDCPGCEWLRADAAERRRLAGELSRLGEERLAEIAEQSVEDLVRDWHAHIRRDHLEGTARLDRAEVPSFLADAR